MNNKSKLSNYLDNEWKRAIRFMPFGANIVFRDVEGNEITREQFIEAAHEDDYMESLTLEYAAIKRAKNES